VIDFSKRGLTPAMLKRVADACREYAHVRPDHNYGLCYWLRHYLNMGDEAAFPVNVFLQATWKHELFGNGYVTPEHGFNPTRWKLALKLAYAIDEHLTRPEGAA
jgi:hypothetical protein